MEKTHSVKINYDKSHITDECYPINVKSCLFVRGHRENIVGLHAEIKKNLETLQVHRIYMSSFDVPHLLIGIIQLKKKIYPVEVRINREFALRDINHPFFTRLYRDKEVAIVGTEEY